MDDRQVFDMGDYFSWGRHFLFRQKVRSIYYRTDDLSFLSNEEGPVLPYGLGRSYGDSCLNDNGLLIDSSRMNNFIGFDPEKGLLRCEAGVQITDILRHFVPRGWFMPVTPGTKFVSIGGAIANDVHGKNHHRDGTFGRHVNCFELARSDGSRLICSPAQNGELFRATIGGLGLTGLITWVEIRLKKIATPLIDVEMIKFETLEEFFTLSEESDRDFEYTVSWVDCLAPPEKIGRGIFIRGNHCEGRAEAAGSEAGRSLEPIFSVPFDLPGFLLNRWSMRVFNTLFYNKQREKKVRRITHFDPFFYPLDKIANWNRIYGRQGVFQYQFVLPPEKAGAIGQIMEFMSLNKMVSFLAVLKQFGDLPSPGLLSFPRPGVTMALDFPNKGLRTIHLMKELDEIVLHNGGVFYPAKDSIMDPETFKRCYPRWRDFEKYIDPKFSSSFWRRVTKS